DFVFDLRQCRSVAGGVVHVVGHPGTVGGTQEEVDERVGIVQVLGIGRDGHGVDEHQSTGGGQQRNDFILATRFFHAICGEVDITRPTNEHASLATSDVVNHGAGE